MKSKRPYSRRLELQSKQAIPEPGVLCHENHQAEPEAMASYNIEEKTAPTTLEEALAGEDAEAWRKGLQKELTSLAKHETLKPVKREHWMRVFKSKLVFKIKSTGEHKVRAVVMAFKKMFKQGIDYKENYAATARWGTIMLILVLAVFFDYNITLMFSLDCFERFVLGQAGQFFL